VLYLVQLFDPIARFSEWLGDFRQGLAALGKIVRLLQAEEAIAEEPGALELPDDGRVELRNVSFGYAHGPPVVHGVSLTLEAGEHVALVSDAGLPGINDPGARLIAASLAAGVQVTVLPGPSAVETALVASGLVAERYQFIGYLPRGRAALSALWEEVARWPWAAVAFESPRRLQASIASLAETAPGRPVAVCRELTKVFEEVVRGTAAGLAERFAEPVRGEVTLVIGAAAPGECGVDAAGRADALAAVAELVAAGAARRSAAMVVARLTGVPRNLLYRTTL
jgi:16S rRNA (cytidine1402-2'-O)-methyltransferase